MLHGRTVSLILVYLIGLGGCSFKPFRPCSEGGQAPREELIQFRGTKRCYQVPDSTGTYVNDGKYLEWHLNEQMAIEGEYEKGKKTGRWIEYDDKGNRISDKYFKEGKEIPRP